jgi:uncharacterized protein YajQ (UPF0234 family)
MPTFDIVSEVDLQEVRNAVDQAAREIANRFDFKGTGSAVELVGSELRLTSNADERLKAVIQVVEEKLVKRKVSLKALDYGKVEEGSKGVLRQVVTMKAGIDSDRAKRVNTFLKGLGVKGVSSQTQGEQIRVTAKKRDDLQAAIAALRAQDFDLPLQFTNFRD